MIKLTTGEKLKELIEDDDISISEMAEKLGVNRRQITRWESDNAEMGIMKLKMLCELYNVSADYMLNLPDNLRWPRRPHGGEG